MSVRAPLFTPVLIGGCDGCMSEIVDSFDDPVYEQTEGGAND